MPPARIQEMILRFEIAEQNKETPKAPHEAPATIPAASATVAPTDSIIDLLRDTQER